MIDFAAPIQDLKQLIALQVQKNRAVQLEKKLDELHRYHEIELLVELHNGTFNLEQRIALRKQREREATAAIVEKINKTLVPNQKQREALIIALTPETLEVEDDDAPLLATAQEKTIIQLLKEKHAALLREKLSHIDHYLSEIEAKKIVAKQNEAFQAELRKIILDNPISSEQTLDSVEDPRRLLSILEHELARDDAYRKILQHENWLERLAAKVEKDKKEEEKKHWLTYVGYFFGFTSALHQAKGFALSCGFTMGGSLLLLLATIPGVPTWVVGLALPFSIIIVWAVTRANWWICNQVVPNKIIQLFCEGEFWDNFRDDFVNLRWGKVAGHCYAFANSLLTALVWGVFTYVSSYQLITCFAEELGFAGTGLIEIAIVISAILGFYTVPTFFLVCLTGWEKNVNNYEKEANKFSERIEIIARIKNLWSGGWVNKAEVIWGGVVFLTLVGLFTTAIAATPAFVVIYEIFGASLVGAYFAAYVTTAIFGFLGAAAFYEHMSRESAINKIKEIGEEGGEFDDVVALKNDPLALNTTPDYSDAIRAHQNKYASQQSFWERTKQFCFEHIWKHINIFTTRKSWHDKHTIDANAGFQGFPSAFGGESSLPSSGNTFGDGVLAAFYFFASFFSSKSVNAGGNQPVPVYDDPIARAGEKSNCTATVLSAYPKVANYEEPIVQNLRPTYQATDYSRQYHQPAVDDDSWADAPIPEFGNSLIY